MAAQDKIFNNHFRISYCLHFVCAVSLILLMSTEIFAQKEYSNWCFGRHGHISFNTLDGSPIALAPSAISQHEGCASISDREATLLFYTDGVTVWNRDHKMMVNGDSLHGSITTTQSALIVKQPCSNSYYYIFNPSDQGSKRGVCYSIVDMKLDSGRGAVIEKNNFLYQPSTEQLIAVQHSNMNDFWIITHKLDSDEFFIYLLTDQGLDTIPSVIATGWYHNLKESYGVGYMKASKDSKKIALAYTGDPSRIEIYDFDNSSGNLTNPMILEHSKVQFFPYGIEFSPDASKLYCTIYHNPNGECIAQFDLNYETAEQMYENRKILTYEPITFAALQLAPDGKIYVAPSQQKWLSVINKPNLLGNACNFQLEAVLCSNDSSASSSFGLPNNIAGLSETSILDELDSICSGAEIEIPFSVFGIFAEDNIFSVQLSDKNGEFDSPLEIGKMQDSVARDILCHIPIGLEESPLYRIRIVSSNPAITGLPSEKSYHILPQQEITFSDFPELCNLDKPLVLEHASPNGGEYSGPGVVSGIFYPETVAPGEHEISYKYVNELGCENISEQNILVLPSPEKPVINQNGLFLVSSSETGNQWYCEGELIDGAVEQSYKVNASGNYSVQVKEENGCESLMSEPFYLLVSVEENFENRRFKVFPNPANDKVNLQYSLYNCRNVKIDIRGCLGRKILSVDKGILNPGEYTLCIDIVSLPDGVYFCTFSTGDYIEAVRFVVMR